MFDCLGRHDDGDWQPSQLPALAHALKPVVLIGKKGWGDAVRAQVEEALLIHELIKIKLSDGGDEDLDSDGLQKLLETELGATVAQVIGHTLVAYRAHPKKPTIVLPKKSALGGRA